jgi:DNA-directed RNA polymerase specialized sigma24 family protein
MRPQRPTSSRSSSIERGCDTSPGASCATTTTWTTSEQETFAVALSRSPDDPRALRSWLGVVASRFALQKRRGEVRRTRREDAVAAPEVGERSAADLVAEAEAHGNVVQAVRALAEPYRTTVLMRLLRRAPDRRGRAASRRPPGDGADATAPRARAASRVARA